MKTITNDPVEKFAVNRFGKGLLLTIFLTLSCWANGQSWIPRATYPANADGALCFSVNDKIYVGGGIGSKQFRQYDPVADTWTLKAPLPTGSDRSFATAFAVNGKGYMCAGIDGMSEKRDLWEYDPTANTWTQKANFPGLACDGMFCFVIGNKVYVGAGEDAFTQAQYKSVYVYDPAADTWTPKNDYPTSGVIYPFSFAINGMGYVSCGQQALEIKTTYQYNPATDAWAPKADYLGSARQAGVSFVLNNKAYCGLGMDQAGFYNSFYSYNPVGDSWTADISIPDSGRSFPCAAIANGRAYAGIGWSYTTADVYHKDWWEYSVPSGVAMQQQEASGIVCYPNPAKGTVTITLKDAAIATGKLNLYNTAGQLIFSDNWNNGTSTTLPVLPVGQYLLELQTAHESFHSKLIVDK